MKAFILNSLKAFFIIMQILNGTNNNPQKLKNPVVTSAGFKIIVSKFFLIALKIYFTFFSKFIFNRFHLAYNFDGTVHQSVLCGHKLRCERHICSILQSVEL